MFKNISSCFTGCCFNSESKSQPLLKKQTDNNKIVEKKVDQFNPNNNKNNFIELNESAIRIKKEKSEYKSESGILVLKKNEIESFSKIKEEKVENNSKSEILVLKENLKNLDQESEENPETLDEVNKILIKLIKIDPNVIEKIREAQKNPDLIDGLMDELIEKLQRSKGPNIDRVKQNMNALQERLPIHMSQNIILKNKTDYSFDSKKSSIELSK